MVFVVSFEHFMTFRRTVGGGDRLGRQNSSSQFRTPLHLWTAWTAGVQTVPGTGTGDGDGDMRRSQETGTRTETETETWDGVTRRGHGLRRRRGHGMEPRDGDTDRDGE